MRRCSISGCCERHKGKGLCNKHYQARIREQKKGNNWSKREERNFWLKVDKNDGCWNWTAMLDRGGYGILSVNAAPFKSHRFSWLIHNGPIPDGLQVLHKCDNRKCVNPDHLFLGTTQDNTTDRDNKGRQTQGEDHYDAKLTENAVKELRRVYVKGSRRSGVRALARRLGLSRSTVKAAIEGRTWKGVQ